MDTEKESLFRGTLRYLRGFMIWVIIGLCLGLVAYIWCGALIPATDPITAAAIGVVSGLCATGVHQVWKQNFKETENDG